MNRPALLRKATEIFRMPPFAIENRLQTGKLRPNHIGIALAVAHSEDKTDDVFLKQLLAMMYLDYGVKSRLARMLQTWLEARKRQDERNRRRGEESKT